jgi:heat shock protein HspQ
MNATKQFKIGEQVQFDYHPYSTISGTVVDEDPNYVSVKFDKVVTWEAKSSTYTWDAGYEMDFLKSKIEAKK